jgi:hypothetical protein
MKAITDSSFSAQGSFSSPGNFGEMGTERNGSYAGQEMDMTSGFEQNQTNTDGQWNEVA